MSTKTPTKTAAKPTKVESSATLVSIPFRCSPEKRRELKTMAAMMDTSIQQLLERGIEALKREMNRA